jgi:hypothetical protein
MPFVSGFLRVRERGHPDNELPGMEGPVDPGYGHDMGGSIDNSLPPGTPPIGVNLPSPPPGIWPPPSFGRPIVPIGPDNTLPVQPGTIWPSPGRPPHAGNVLPGTGHPGGGPMPGGEGPDNTLPGGSGGRPDNTLPSGKFWVVAGIPGIGWRYVCVDPSLEVGMPLPPAPAPK